MKKQEKDDYDYNFVKALAEKMVEQERAFDGVYVIDPDNYRRFMEVCEYFRWLAKESGGKVVYTDFAPDSANCGISIDVPILDLPHDSLQKFLEILEKVDVFGVSPTVNDSILVDASVNYVWKAVPKE